MTKHELGDAPIEPRYEATMQAIAASLDDVLNGKERPRHTGFLVMVFPFADFDGRCNYVSNARREDVIVLLKEQLARFQGMPEVKAPKQ